MPEKKEKEKFTCDNCGKEFLEFKSQVKDNKNVFCSRECFYKYMKGRKKDIVYTSKKCTCEFCGEEFQRVPSFIRGKTYCSSECFGKSNIKLREKYNCSYCGKEILRLQSHVKNPDNNVFCNKDCLNKSKIGKEPWNKNKKWSEETIEKLRKASTGKRRTEEDKLKMSGENNPKYEGGYYSKNIPRYDLYAPRLEPIEKCRRNKEDENILEVRCTYCGKWFIPTMQQTRGRIEGINDNDRNRFYCSNDCKKECPIYHKSATALIRRDEIASGRISPNELNREVQPELRKLVFARDDYTCQKCEQIDAPLHCHHYEGIEQNPIESADSDNCVTLCVPCHMSAHEEIGCRRIDLRKCIHQDEEKFYSLLEL